MLKRWSLILIYLISCNYIQTFETSCLPNGICSVQYQLEKSVIDIGYKPIIPLKFIEPFKKYNGTSDPPSNLNILSTNEFEKINPYISDTSYQCADGIGECINSCCYKGKCLDPSNVCFEYQSYTFMIISLTAVIMGLFIVFYWIAFYLIGIKHNSKPIVSKHDKELYNKRIESNSKSKEEKSENLVIKRKDNLHNENMAIQEIPHSNLNMNNK
jgi:hypothetical protein